MKKRYKGKGFAAVLLTVTGLFAGAVTSQGGARMLEAPYDWEGNADKSGYDGVRYIDSGDMEDFDSMEELEITSGRDRYTDSGGPGETSGSMEEQEITSGPTVAQVTLAERYHEEYKVYEESINGMFFFYTNVSNGGITDQAVTLDMPQNLFCSVEKDGAEYGYVPGQAFSEYGTYVVRITAVEDTSVHFSEQKEYRALFRFRIQAKPPEETTEAVEGSQGLPQGLISGGPGMAPGLQEGGIRPDGGIYGISEEGVGLGLEESVPEGLESEPESVDASEDSAGEMTEGETAGKEEDGREEDQEGAKGNREDGAEEGVPEDSGGRTQVYNSSSGRYEVAFGNGRTLSSNVPEGYMGPGAVELLISEGEGSIYRNDELLDYTESMSLNEPGYYRLDIGGQMWSFTIASAVGSMDYYMAPVGMEFTGVYFDGEPGELPEGRYLPMREDGRYQITMAGEEGETLEVVLRKDTQPPLVEVNARGGTAQIQYGSDDIEKVILEKDGEIQEGFAGYTIDSPGSYRLTAVDEAGNASSTEFSLRYQVNVYGIVAVVLVILLIAGGVVFVIHVKRTVKVR